MKTLLLFKACILVIFLSSCIFKKKSGSNKVENKLSDKTMDQGLISRNSADERELPPPLKEAFSKALEQIKRELHPDNKELMPFDSFASLVEVYCQVLEARTDKNAYYSASSSAIRGLASLTCKYNEKETYLNKICYDQIVQYMDKYLFVYFPQDHHWATEPIFSSILQCHPNAVSILSPFLEDMEKSFTQYNNAQKKLSVAFLFRMCNKNKLTSPWKGRLKVLEAPLKDIAEKVANVKEVITCLNSDS